MGYYIDVPEERHKADQLVEMYGAELLDFTPKFGDIDPDQALICVVDNGPFEAAAYCFDADELDAFNDPDDSRPKFWLTMDRALAEELCDFE